MAAATTRLATCLHLIFVFIIMARKIAAANGVKQRNFQPYAHPAQSLGQNFPLHQRVFRIDFAAMSLKRISTALLAIALSFGALAAPNSPQSKGNEEPSFFERYTSAAQDVILKGFELVGVRYRWGGNDADSGLDCSGFVRLVFKDTIGTLLPRTAREMSEVGQNVDSVELKPGDLVFFNTMKRAFSHVGIYLGDNYFLHAPRKGAEIRVEDMRQSYWTQRYNGARRIIEK